MTRPTLRALLGVLIGAMALLGVGATPAAAHAELVLSDPADGARLDEAPAKVRLEFSENVSADLGGLQVVDVEGGRVDEGSVRNDGEIVEVDLQPGLPQGTYVTTYRVVSADGHPIKGGLVFSVGEEIADTGALDRFYDSGGDRAWEVAGAVARTLAYAGVLIAAGGAAFLTLVHTGGGAERPALERTVRIAAAIGAAGVLVGLPISAALGTGGGIGSIFDDGVLSAVLGEGVGWSVLLAMGGLALCMAGLAKHAPTPLVLIGAAAAAASFAASGHTRATDPAWRATLVDVAHLLAAAVWLGGLVLLLLTLRMRNRDPDADTAMTAGMVARFSSIAGLALIAVAIPGTILAWEEVRSLDALTSTTYGWLLIAKVALVALVALVAGYNRYRLVPALPNRAKAALRQLRHTLRLEVGGLLVALAVTGVLVNVTPARVDAGVDGGIAETTIDLGETGSVQLVVDPAPRGP